MREGNGVEGREGNSGQRSHAASQRRDLEPHCNSGIDKHELENVALKKEKICSCVNKTAADKAVGSRMIKVCSFEPEDSQSAFKRFTGTNDGESAVNVASTGGQNKVYAQGSWEKEQIPSTNEKCGNKFEKRQKADAENSILDENTDPFKINKISESTPASSSSFHIRCVGVSCEENVQEINF
jgi:hypothetical protein